jgi:hypothetical protein
MTEKYTMKLGNLELNDMTVGRKLEDMETSNISFLAFHDIPGSTQAVQVMDKPLTKLKVSGSFTRTKENEELYKLLMESIDTEPVQPFYHPHLEGLAKVRITGCRLAGGSPWYHYETTMIEIREYKD